MNRRMFCRSLLGGFAAATGIAALPSVPAQFSVPMTWTAPCALSGDKEAMIRALLTNAIQAHDDAIEQALSGSTPNAIVGTWDGGAFDEHCRRYGAWA